MTMKKAFTLIELLIVVAIIAILAAIAVPNFLEAQTRSKVSRVKADLRTMATAIEAYSVDHNMPPREWRFAYDGAFRGQNNASGIVGPVISTPIAYITSAYIDDPFIGRGDNWDEDQKVFSYANIIERERRRATLGGNVWFFGGPLSQAQRSEALQAFFGSWYMMSIGPDQRYDNNMQSTNPNSTLDRGSPLIPGREYMVYDPTNGTISDGNIIRSAAGGDDRQIPNQDILGPH